MIRLASTAPLSPLARHGLDALLDASRLVPVDDGDAPVAELRIVATPIATGLQALELAAWGMRAVPGGVELALGALEQVGALVGLVAEQRSGEADRVGRVPATTNPCIVAGMERRPVVARAGARLRELARATGLRYAELAPWPDGRHWAVALTHDVDVVEGWPAFTALRLAELGKRAQFGRIGRVLGAAATHVAASPAAEGVEAVLEIEARHGVRSTWYFLVGDPTARSWRRGDVTYRIEGDTARRMLALVQGAAGEVGLHGSLDTMDDAALLRIQRDRLATVTGTDIAGVRQHFLRLRPGRTHAHMAAAGFAYDATVGFADRSGFRTGHADPTPAWDAQAGASLPLDLLPLAWMDRTLSKYRGVEDPARWIADAMELADAVREAHGVWQGLWHPNLVAALGFPGALEAYAALCAALAERQPWMATAQQVIAWRARRRSARAVHVPADGPVALRVRGAGAPLRAIDRVGAEVPVIVEAA